MKKLDREKLLRKMRTLFFSLVPCAFILLLCMINFCHFFLAEIDFNNTVGQWRSNLADPHAYVAAKIFAFELYHAYAADVKQLLPGVVCWGDEAAVGIKNCSLASKMSEEMNRALFGGFKEAAAPYYSYLNLKILTLNMGVKNEGMNEILARCGASPILLGEDYTVPDYGYMSNVSLMDAQGNELRFAIQPYTKFDRTTIRGIAGYLYVGAGSYDKDHPHIAFARDSLGGQVSVPKGTRVKTETAEIYQSFLPILYFQSTLGQTDEAFVQSLTKILDYHQNTGGYYTVIV